MDPGRGSGALSHRGTKTWSIWGIVNSSTCVVNYLHDTEQETNLERFLLRWDHPMFPLRSKFQQPLSDTDALRLLSVTNAHNFYDPLPWL